MSKPRRPRLPVVADTLAAALVGQRIVRLLEPLNPSQRSVAMTVVGQSLESICKSKPAEADTRQVDISEKLGG